MAQYQIPGSIDAAKPLQSSDNWHPQYKKTFDPKAALDRVTSSLSAVLNPPFNRPIDRNEERQVVDQWYRKATGTIAAAQAQYQRELRLARESGTLSEEDCVRAAFDASVLTSPFAKIRSGVDEKYWQETKGLPGENLIDILIRKESFLRDS